MNQKIPCKKALPHAMFVYGLPLLQLMTSLQQDLPPPQTTNEFEILQADIEGPNVSSTEDEEPTELVNTEVEFIRERSTTESRDAPIVAASLIDHALSITNKSTPVSSTMPPPPP
ncbi:hypothetical protein K3495_g15364 [Podosphaera aphanis]|nr:hypothetical protein K3495_g15364 [Podosphaera aphanis]